MFGNAIFNNMLNCCSAAINNELRSGFSLEEIAFRAKIDPGSLTAILEKRILREQIPRAMEVISDLGYTFSITVTKKEGS